MCYSHLCDVIVAMLDGSNENFSCADLSVHPTWKSYFRHFILLRIFEPSVISTILIGCIKNNRHVGWVKSRHVGWINKCTVDTLTSSNMAALAMFILSRISHLMVIVTAIHVSIDNSTHSRSILRSRLLN